jgi:hypothetical protein
MTARPRDPLRLAIDDRRRELKLTMAEMDHAAGLQDGYFAKYMCGSRNFGPGTLAKVIAVLGVQIVLVPEGMLASLSKLSTGSHQKIRSIGSLGGKARAAALAPEARSAIAQKAAAARWSRRKWQLRMLAGQRARFKRGPRGKAAAWARQFCAAIRMFER